MFYPQSKSGENMIEAKVYVEFKVNSEGIIEISKIESTNEEMIQYVANKLAMIHAEQNFDVIGKDYKYCFSFEVQK